ncbi:MAG: alcohol dehydrogenase catalytic domain-containing protein [Sulfolobales archaeon]|nr:alcohol dehydrogenase catalytic domain-containing protein [Sulfolobales archaeon]MCX8186011.1 alcohol dehydrogenase catalytic domain-containing protein [Sulfolobales archaeon]MDW7969268.1 alcohol dehydrogenase catalytic domain-containing protein [Sulfolobales archaeon]
MKAALLRELQKPLVIEEVPDPVPAYGEALIKVKAVGICHSDLEIIDGKIPPAKLPIILGHEVAGVVESVGDGVKHLKPGDKVALSWLWWTCGRCKPCLSGRENICENQLNTGYVVDGGYAELVKAPATHLIKIPEGVSFPEATSATDAVATPYRSLTYASKVVPGDLVSVFGVGGLGHNAVQVAKALGAKVVAVDILESKLEFAKEVGADYTVNASKEDPVKYIKNLGGADVAVTPVESLKAMRQAYDSLRAGGTLVLVGLPVGELSLPVIDWILKDVKVVGNIGFTRGDIMRSLELVAAGMVRPRVELFKFEEVNAAIEKLRRGEVKGRAVLTF